MSTSLKVECPHCSGSLKLKDRSADGKKVRCPKCQEVFKVELPEEDLDDVDDFGDDFGGDDELPEEEEFPRKSKGSSKKPVKKKRKSSGSGIPWLIIGIAAVALFALGGVVFVVSQLAGSSGGKNKIDLTYLPPDSNMVMFVKSNEMMTSPLLADVMKQPAVEQMFQLSNAETGLPLRELTSVTIGMIVDETNSAINMPMGPPGMNRMGAAPTPPRMLTVVRCSVPLKPEEIGVTLLKGTAQAHGGKTYYKKPHGDRYGTNVGDSLYFPEPNVVVMGLEAEIKQAIDRGSKQKRRKEFDFINPDMTLVVAFAAKLASNPNAPIQSPASQPALQALEKATNKSVRGFSFGVRITDKIDLELIAKCSDNAGAGEVKTAVDGIFTELKNQFGKSKTVLQLMDMNDVIDLAEKSLASLKVESSGVIVTAAGTVPSAVKTVGQGLASKMPGMMGMGGPPGGFGGPPGMTPPGSSGGISGADFPPGQLPPGAFPPGTAPPGAFPPGAFPPGAIPPGGIPPGAVPPGTTLPGTTLPGTTPPGAIPGGVTPPSATPPTAPPTTLPPGTATAVPPK